MENNSDDTRFNRMLDGDLTISEEFGERVFFFCERGYNPGHLIHLVELMSDEEKTQVKDMLTDDFMNAAKAICPA